MLTGRLVSRVKLRNPPLRVKNLGEEGEREEREREGEGEGVTERKIANNTN